MKAWRSHVYLSKSLNFKIYRIGRHGRSLPCPPSLVFRGRGALNQLLLFFPLPFLSLFSFFAMADSGEGSFQPPPPAPVEEVAPTQPSGEMDVDGQPTSAPPSSSSIVQPQPPPAPIVEASTPTPVPEVPTPSQDAPPPPAATTDEPLIEKEAQQEEEEEQQPSEVELLRASHLRKEIEQEQAVADALERVTELEKLLDSEEKHVSEAKAMEEGLGTSSFTFTISFPSSKRRRLFLSRLIHTTRSDQ